MMRWLMLLITGMAVAAPQPSVQFKPYTGEIVKVPGMHPVQPKFPPVALAAWKNLLLAMGAKADDAYLMSSKKDEENASARINKKFDVVARYLSLHPTTFKQTIPWTELRYSPTAILHAGGFQIEGSLYFVTAYTLNEQTLLDINLSR